MSLDIALLGPEGSPKAQVSIGVNDHHRLMQLVGESGGLLARLNDYYADSEFDHSELENLIEEVKDMGARCRDDERLFSFLTGLARLIETAKSEGRALVVIAD